MREDQIVHAGVGRKFQTPSVYEDLTVFENLELNYPKGHGVFGALIFKRDIAVRARIKAKRYRKAPWSAFRTTPRSLKSIWGTE